MNFIEMKFTNPVLAEIFGSNNASDGLFDTNGTVDRKFNIDDAVPPKNTEDFISIFFCVLEKNSEVPAGENFAKAKESIYKDTVLRLSDVVHGFGDIELTISIDSVNEQGNNVNKKSVTKISRNKN